MDRAPGEGSGAVPNDAEERRRKYDVGADDYSERFADPKAIVDSYLRLLSSWGTPVRPGEDVVELGCADGFITLALARAGYRVTAVDLSPRMIEVARDRLGREGLDAQFIVADIREMDWTGSSSAVLGLMRSFFSYVEDPPSVLRAIARNALKVLVDVDPRHTDLEVCETAVREAGFARVAHRPIFVPTRYRISPPVRAALRAAEMTPGLRALILRRKFLVVVKGEHDRS
jgi:SAM-dependent methyltransferase